MFDEFGNEILDEFGIPIVPDENWTTSNIGLNQLPLMYLPPIDEEVSRFFMDHANEIRRTYSTIVDIIDNFLLYTMSSKYGRIAFTTPNPETRKVYMHNRELVIIHPNILNVISYKKNKEYIFRDVMKAVLTMENNGEQ